MSEETRLINGDDLEQGEEEMVVLEEAPVQSRLDAYISPVKRKILYVFVTLVLGPILAIPFMFDILYPGHIAISRCVAVIIITASWWILEPIPIAIGSLAPFWLFPMFGITGAGDIATAYFNDQIFLFISSYMVAIGLEEWNLHKRIALFVLKMTRGIPILILGGFMLIGSFLSMWLNNTSTAAMLLPMASAILKDLDEKEPDPMFSKAIMLAIPYCASIGGFATLTGTGTNLVFTFQMGEMYPKYGNFSFLTWMSFAAPLSAIFLIICWIYFVILFIRKWKLKTELSYFQTESDKLGSLKYEEWIMIIAFLLLCTGWITRDLPVGKHIGWGFLFKDKFMTDATVSTIVSFALFIVPSISKPDEAILTWKAVNKKMPWNIVLLLGAGFSLARGFERAEFSQFVAHTIRNLGSLPILLILFLICLFLSFATEFMSNVVCASIAIPILGRSAPEISQNPLLFMIPATIACSFAFMSPIATPPNAIAFGYGRLKIFDMIKNGFLLNLMGVGLLIGWMYVAGPFLGIELGKVPAWALRNSTRSN